VDTVRDPYSAIKGFFYAHIGWMLIKQDKENIGRADITGACGAALALVAPALIEPRTCVAADIAVPQPVTPQFNACSQPSPLPPAPFLCSADLNTDPICRLQHKYYLLLAPLMGLVVPTIACGLLWGDYWGGYFIAGVARLVMVHHSTFFVNSLAHYAGAATYTDGHTARNSWITALLTLGEGYHNFHHEFPNDYRNGECGGRTFNAAACGQGSTLSVGSYTPPPALTAPRSHRATSVTLPIGSSLPSHPACAGIEWYQYDPTKLFIRACAALGCAYDLNVFPQNEVDKGVLQMRQKALDVDKLRVDWGPTAAALPVWTRAQFDARAGEEKAKWAGGDKSARILFILDGFVLDVAPFLPLHPGGGALLSTEIGNDVTVRGCVAVCSFMLQRCVPAVAAEAGACAQLRQDFCPSPAWRKRLHKGACTALTRLSYTLVCSPSTSSLVACRRSSRAGTTSTRTRRATCRPCTAWLACRGTGSDDAASVDADAADAG
jgi:cytochrome b involved in lipid metabolism